CSLLAASFPSQTFFSSQGTYQDQQSTYYSASQASLTPTCRVSPKGPSDVAKILAMATQDENRCQFAVRTGGHMAWSGASNIGKEGFTIDLQELVLEDGQARVRLSEDKAAVSFSAGVRWRDVYRVLKPENLTTVGGRIGDVGVGGFLLGGDYILNYEIVLFNGTIINANGSSHSDLYWALKLGSTNYGIVTRFDMVTYPQGPVWGGSQFFSIHDAPVLLNHLVAFTKNFDKDPKAFFGLSLAWNPQAKDYIIWTLQTYLKPVPYPSPLWDDLRDSTAKPLIDMMGIKNLVDVTEEFKEADPGKHGRSRWLSMTYKPDVKFHLDLHAKGVELFEPYHDHPGVHWAVSIQPIPKKFSGASSVQKRGENPSCLKQETGDLWVMVITTDWLDPADDKVMNTNAETLLEWAEDEARKRGLFHPFIYPNYASGSQSVMERSTSPEALRKMGVISRMYDPKGVLNELWRGGFKISRRGELEGWVYDRVEL
ncbi:hypothetical protein GYMLUDRAFT_179541, partial [Collybiopsis luxurians FD-317 M1]